MQVFTVDDGEPRRIDDPANTEFLQSIRQGVCPQELLASNGGRPIKVNLVRKQTEYTPPAQPRSTIDAFERLDGFLD